MPALTSYGFFLCSAVVLCVNPVVALFPLLVATGLVLSRPAKGVQIQ